LVLFVGVWPGVGLLVLVVGVGWWGGGGGGGGAFGVSPRWIRRSSVFTLGCGQRGEEIADRVNARRGSSALGYWLGGG